CQGDEACACYANGTCNAGLSCLSSICVNTNPGADSGDPESGMSSKRDGGGSDSGFVFPLPDGSVPPESGAPGPDGAGGELDAQVDVRPPPPDVGVPDVATVPDAQSPTNMIVGGDFSNSGYAWHLLVGYDATISSSGGEGCLTMHVNEAGGIGWPS